MSIVIWTLTVLAYFSLAVFGWRLGYVSGYEAKAAGLYGYSWQSREECGRNTGILCALLAPIAVPALLVARLATPVPPSLARERQEESDRRIAALERELGLKR